MRVRLVPFESKEPVMEFRAGRSDDLAEVAKSEARKQGIEIPKARYRFECKRQVTIWEPIGASAELSS